MITRPLLRRQQAEDSYGTNNQVKGVDEADIIKSNGSFVFAAYGDLLVVWDAMKGDKQYVMKFKQEKKSRLRSIAVGTVGLKIRSLLIYENRLAVIVDGYSSDPEEGVSSTSLVSPPGILGRGKTKVQLFDISTIISNGNELSLIATKDIRGNYKDARLVGDTVHVISKANVDTYYHLTRYMNRGQKRFKSLNGTEYKANVISYARALLIPSYVERIMEEMGFENDTCKNVLRMSILRKTDQEISVPSVGSIMNGFVEVVSFSILGDHSGSSFDSKNLASFVPTGNGHGTLVYSSADSLVIAHRGYEYEALPRASWVPNTFLMSFSLEDSYLNGVQIQGTAQIPGYVINQHALDIWGGHLRVASSIDAKWGCSPDETQESSGVKLCTWKIVHDSSNFLSILKIPSASQTSLTMERVGYLDNLGEFGEKIEAVRFMENKGWIVTFLRTDPLYSIDLSNHTSPRIMGELKVTGYSNYLHPYDEEFKLLIGVGQDADKNGQATGLQISLFDVSDLSKTFLIHRYNVEDGDQKISSSSSQAQYDPKAFRFLYGSKKLIIPTSIRDSKSGDVFDGFNVFDVSIADGIKVSFNVSHIDDEALKRNCWNGAYIPPRSLVHGGVLTTVKGHSVLAHNLNTGEKSWELSLNSDNRTDCAVSDYWMGI